MVNLGLKVRATHETKLNASSSRSHTVFTFSVLQRDKVCVVIS
jgi:Kinesin motor domain